MGRKIKLGMAGGGIGSFIGAVHRKAAALDGQFELVCGAFSSSPERSRATGRELYLPESRVYDTYHQMFEAEKALPEEERMDVVAIVTPNHLHYEPAKIALESGFHVICDKPVTYALKEAEDLKLRIEKTGLLFALTHTYAGYPMVKQARDMLAGGVLGEIRKVVVKYPQGWLSDRIEQINKQAAWRTDPERAGKAGAMGDIGTHAEHLLKYITGLKILEICADISTLVEGRKLDDDGNILLRLQNGATGVMHVSQICAGEENDLGIYIYGEKGGMEWHQQEPNTLWLKHKDRPDEKYRSGIDNEYLSKNALSHCRLPAGHPEGYLEAFANIYVNVATTIRARRNDEDPPPWADFPTIEDGIEGMQFIEALLKSEQSSDKWVKIENV